MSDQHSEFTLSDRNAEKILRFMHVAERLKEELRHSFTSGGRQESVAEHSWRVVLLASLLRPYLPVVLNWERLIEMLAIHDLVEAKAGDIPIFDLVRRNGKPEAERRAMEHFGRILPPEVGLRIQELWAEFEKRISLEAQVAHALDKLEAQVQHNEANLETWLDWEKRRVFGGLDEVSSCDPAVSTFKDTVVQEAVKKLRDAGEDVKGLANNGSSQLEAD